MCLAISWQTDLTASCSCREISEFGSKFMNPSEFDPPYHNDMWGSSESLTCGSGSQILKGSRIET